MNKQIIRINGLNKYYKFSDSSQPIIKRIFLNKKIVVQAIKDFDLDVQSGEIVGLLGMNGAGKTSLIKIMTGILREDSGCVEILGYSPSKERYNYTYNIGVVMGQKSLLWNNIPPIESLKLYKNIYELNDELFHERLEEFEQIFEVKNLLNIPVRKLSLGQRMKCEIVASLLHNPKVLFLDEPTIGLDIVSKKQIYEMLLKMNKKFNTTIIMTTHNLGDIEALCKRIVILDKGKKIFDGAKDNLTTLDENREIVFTVEDESTKQNFSKYHRFDHCKYSIICELNNLSKELKEISGISNVLDIQITSQNLESIVEGIYKGDINI